MRNKNFSTVIEGLNPKTPYAYVFVMQASAPNGVALTTNQINAAITAAENALAEQEATVDATCSVIPLDPVGENEQARLLINCKQEIEAISVEALVDKIIDESEAVNELGLNEIDEAE